MIYNKSEICINKQGYAYIHTWWNLRLVVWRELSWVWEQLEAYSVNGRKSRGLHLRSMNTGATVLIRFLNNGSSHMRCRRTGGGSATNPDGVRQAIVQYRTIHYTPSASRARSACTSASYWAICSRSTCLVAHVRWCTRTPCLLLKTRLHPGRVQAKELLSAEFEAFGMMKYVQSK